jgi:hypothetical protein
VRISAESIGRSLDLTGFGLQIERDGPERVVDRRAYSSVYSLELRRAKLNRNALLGC